MTTKNLAILGAAAVVLGGTAWYCNSGRTVRAPSIVGEKILPSFDVADVARIEIGGAKKVQLVADDKGWKLQSLYGYPADVTKIRENLLKLTELKVGQVANGKKIASPATVDIQNAAGKSLAALPLGETHTSKPKGQAAMYGGGGYPDGRYVEYKGKTVLVKETLDAFDGDPKKWVDTRIASVSASDVQSVVFEQGKEKVSPSGLFGFAKVLMGVAPPVRTVYWKMETAKLERFKKKLSVYHERVQEDVKAAVEKGREVREELGEKAGKVREELGEKAHEVREEIKDKFHGV